MLSFPQSVTDVDYSLKKLVTGDSPVHWLKMWMMFGDESDAKLRCKDDLQQMQSIQVYSPCINRSPEDTMQAVPHSQEDPSNGGIDKPQAQVSLQENILNIIIDQPKAKPKFPNPSRRMQWSRSRILGQDQPGQPRTSPRSSLALKNLV